MADRIAVTGASGFVGRHLTAQAAARGWEVVGSVRAERGARTVLEAGGLPTLIPQLAPEPLLRAFAGARAVVHLAQIGSERAGETYQAVNVQGTRLVVAAALEAGVRRIVFLSGLGVAHYGMKRRCTNPYFLSKLAAELEILRSGLEAVVFRPSWIVGPGGGLIPGLLREMAAGEVERVGDGSFSMQPVAVRDAAAAILAAIERTPLHPAVFDLVGPEPVAYQALLHRVARIARSQGRAVGEYRVREVSLEEADRRAAAGGYRGMPPEELDCLLCDEVSDPRPLEALLGGCLTPVDEALAAAIRATRDFAPGSVPQ